MTWTRAHIEQLAKDGKIRTVIKVKELTAGEITTMAVKRFSLMKARVRRVNNVKYI